MLMKRMIVILTAVLLLTVVFVEPVFATGNFLDDVRGFGKYNFSELANGEIHVDAGLAGSTAKKDMEYWKAKFDKLFIQYGKTITFCTGVATMTLVAVFIWLCVKNAFVASEHWILKRQTMMSMLWVGVGTALMGSTTLILLIFQNAFK